MRVTYVTELTIDDSRLRFVIPTTVSPRYAPATDLSGVGRPDVDTLNPPVAWTVPYGLNLTVHLRMPGAVTAIESPSHPVSLRLNGRDATVSLAQQDVAMDRDFVLSVEAEGFDAPHALCEASAEGHAIGVAFAPRFPTSSVPAEVIFLVDRSGSMGGSSIEEVRNALQLCLRSLTPGCRFNIVGFGSEFESLFRSSRPYDQASLADATAHVQRLDATLGGTEILSPLEFVLRQPVSADLPRQVVILTDGQVTNTDAVLALASAHAGSARIFTFGIGAGASAHLVRGLARAGGGTAEFIAPGERIEPKVLRQLSRLLSPALSDVKVEWVGADVTQVPADVPPVFAGSRLLLYGWAKSGRPSSLRLRANTPSGPLVFEVPITEADKPSAVAAPGAVAILAARARIRELEEGSEWLSGRGSRQHGRREARDTSEIVRLACAYGLLSRETSFVAVERRETPVAGEVQLRRIPVAMTSGWGGLTRSRMGGGRGYGEDDAAIAYSLSPPPRASFDMVMPRLSVSSNFFGRARRLLRKTTEVTHADDRPASSAMAALVILQEADGSWPFNEELAGVLGVELETLREAMDGTPGPEDLVLRAWATALALAWLERNAADAKEEWSLLAKKAQAWLDGAVATPPGGLTWREAAVEQLEG